VSARVLVTGLLLQVGSIRVVIVRGSGCPLRNAAANIRRAPSATISAKRRRRRSAPRRPTTLNIGVIFLTGAPTPVLARLLSEEGTVRALDQLADPQVPVITYEQQIRW
jgi:hypothetical protein